MEVVKVKNIRVHCVYGWGWLRQYLEGRDHVQVETFPVLIEAPEGLALLAHGSGVMAMAADLPNIKIQRDLLLGDKMLIVSRSDEPCQFAEGRIENPLLMFGSVWLKNHLLETAKEVIQRRGRAFLLPETRGFAELVTFDAG